MKVCFFGSRNLSGDSVAAIIRNQVGILKCTEMVTAAEPDGVCAEARKFAEDNRIKLTTVPKQVDKAAGQYHHRSVICYDISDYVVLIHDGQSPGTQNEFDLALKMRMPLTYYCIQIKGEKPTPVKVNGMGFKSIV